MNRYILFAIFTVLLTSTIFGVRAIGLVMTLHKDVFRLSSYEVQQELSHKVSLCSAISDCKLKPGDILFRRYITQRTWFIDKLANPYFTHTAFYLGKGEIIEAVGTEKNRDDDIRIESISKTDWFNQDVKNFVIIRPNRYSAKMDDVIDNLTKIANDSEYIFGIPAHNTKRTTCADLIFVQLAKEGIIDPDHESRIISPDYLYRVLSDLDGYELVGFNLVAENASGHQDQNQYFERDNRFGNFYIPSLSK